MFVYDDVTSDDTIYLVIFNGDTSDIAGRGGRILDVFIFIFNISFKNISYVFVKIVRGATL